MLKILLLTNHLAEFGGSEIVTLEVAETFLKIGCDVSIFAAYIDDPVRSYMNEINLKYDTVDNCPCPENFDIIWSQHQLMPHLLAKYSLSSIENVFLINACLSAYEPLEIPGAVTEVADMIVANSLETAERLVELGVVDEKISVFYNAAPDSFNITRKFNHQLKSVLVISNHMPEEISISIDALKHIDVKADHIGLPFNFKKVTTQIISSYDAVISIGKSVQYSLLCETPVYVYDRFGGPGWLNDDNMENAEKFNFSGRCCHRHLSPDIIVDELLGGYAEAVSAIRRLKHAYSEKYRLHNYLIQIIESVSMRKNKQHARLIPPQVSDILYREGLLSGHLINLSQVTKHQSSEITRLNSKSADLSTQLARIDSEGHKLTHTNEDFLSLQEKQINENNQTISDLEQKLRAMINSTSWKVTKPLRAMKRVMSRALL